MIETPNDVVTELATIRAEAEKGLAILFEAERELAALDSEAEVIEAKAFLAAQGTVADRQAVARLQAADARRTAEEAKAKVSYIKAKLRHLSEATGAVQTSARMVELHWRTAGLGER